MEPFDSKSAFTWTRTLRKVRGWLRQLRRGKEKFGLFEATPLDEVLAQDHPFKKILVMFDEV